jgi:hypothetical protein
MVGKTQRWINGEVAWGECCLKHGAQACLMSRGKQQETASTFLPLWLRRSAFLSRLFFPERGACGMVAHSECRPDTVDLADTDMQVKTLLQFHLNGG